MQTPNVESNQTSSTLSPSIAISFPIPSPTQTLLIPTPYHEHSRVSLAVNADDDSTPNNPLNTQNDSRVHNPQSISCDKCGFHYSLNRLKTAKIISHWASKHFYTMILLLLTVLLVSGIAHFAIKHLAKNGMDGEFPTSHIKKT